jgi:hypothetical protein
LPQQQARRAAPRHAVGFIERTLKAFVVTRSSAAGARHLGTPQEFFSSEFFRISSLRFRAVSADFLARIFAENMGLRSPCSRPVSTAART